MSFAVEVALVVLATGCNVEACPSNEKIRNVSFGNRRRKLKVGYVFINIIIFSF